MNNLNEVKQVIILAAGRSRRMERLSKKEPKCLLPYKGERVLERLVRQIKDCGIEKIVITTGYRADIIKKIFAEDKIVETIENTLYEEDVNIYSMSLALSKVEGSCVIFEADAIMEDDLVKYVLGSDFENKSVWFTRGKFNEAQYGGILKSDKYGNVTDIKIVSAFQNRFKSYEKLSGIMRISSSEIELFKALVNKYARTTLKQYFLNAWMENLKLLPCISADISPFEFFTFNKPEEYYQVQGKEIGVIQGTPEISLIPIKNLLHIENYSEDRVTILLDKIKNEMKWQVPIIVDQKTGLVLDGQHRLEVAKILKLKVIPAILVNYDDIQTWTLRKEEKVSPMLVRKRIKKGDIYPYKTVKHKFNFKIPNELDMQLKDLESEINDRN
ncbi:MAG: NTP transferase domain-containing protein [Beduini sp.]|uniref:NTP transferase domain-containing protein n=1 Tax=Beduini sp. TaxID=1922300 RepID=UPI0039A3E06F